MYEEYYSDVTKLPGDALCSAVRALLWCHGEGMRPGDSTLRFAPRGTSRHLVDSEGTSVRIRRHPWNFRLGCRQGVVPPPIYTLWGIDWSMAPYELAILWTPDYKAKALGTASLAAVGDLDGSSPSIYGRVDLPQEEVRAVPSTRDIPQTSDVTDDFDDFLPDESFGSDDPA